MEIKPAKAPKIIFLLIIQITCVFVSACKIYVQVTCHQKIAWSQFASILPELN